jgi:Uma2 family endonuclease
MVEAGLTRKLTYEDFLGFPEDGRRHELIDGEHFVASAPFIPHQRAVSRLLGHLWGYLERNPLGEVLPAPTDVVLSKHDVVEPDLIYVSAARAGQVGERNVQGPPDLVVEVLSRSTSRLDRGRKLGLYDRAGVGEYWLVDPDAETVTVFRRDETTLKRAADLACDGGEPLTTPLLPGFALALDRLFKRPTPGR